MLNTGATVMLNTGATVMLNTCTGATVMLNTFMYRRDGLSIGGR